MNPVNIFEYEGLARERLSPGAFDYIAGGAGDELTLRENRAAYDRLRLLPRVLVDVTRVDTTVAVLGRQITFPVLVAPMAFQTLAHPDGELAVAQAAARAGTAMVVSTMSAYTMEEVVAAGPGPKWFQLYCYRDREITRALVQRAEAAGFSGVCMTVDLPRVGRRERDLRNQFHLPPTAIPRNFVGLVDVSIPVEVPDHAAFSRYIQELVDPSLTWESVEWVRSVTDLPLILKGILRPDDAREAAARGAAGIVVSNHGARQLDGVPATIEVLEEIAGAVGGSLEVFMDGGVRRGTDVVKALALGATAVLMGRPCLWGLAVSGEEGAHRVLDLLRQEVELAMALLGCPSVGDVTRTHVREER